MCLPSCADRWPASEVTHSFAASPFSWTLNRRCSAVGGTADFHTCAQRPTLQVPINEVISSNAVSCQGWLNQVHSLTRPSAVRWSAYMFIMDSRLAATAVIIAWATFSCSVDVCLSSRAKGAIKIACAGVHQGCANVPCIPEMAHTQVSGLPAMAKSLCHR